MVGYRANTFTTSVTHQLHSIVSAFSSIISSDNSTEEGADEEAWHVSHCSDYLRQSIMCCGYMALEGTHTTFSEGSIGSGDWDAKHDCKDYKQVVTHLEEQRANNDVLI